MVIVVSYTVSLYRISALVRDHTEQLQGAMERASNAREESANLEAQLDLLKYGTVS